MKYSEWRNTSEAESVLETNDNTVEDIAETVWAFAIHAERESCALLAESFGTEESGHIAKAIRIRVYNTER